MEMITQTLRQIYLNLRPLPSAPTVFTPHFIGALIWFLSTLNWILYIAIPYLHRINTQQYFLKRKQA